MEREHSSTDERTAPAKPRCSIGMLARKKTSKKFVLHLFRKASSSSLRSVLYLRYLTWRFGSFERKSSTAIQIDRCCTACRAALPLSHSNFGCYAAGLATHLATTVCPIGLAHTKREYFQRLFRNEVRGENRL